MTRDQIIQQNDNLRQQFCGGRIEVCHGPYDIDDRTMRGMLCAVAGYDRFDPGSLHDEGLMLFAGFNVAWKIETVDGERVLRVWVNDDVLNSAG
jgi:hypothetical protein